MGFNWLGKTIVIYALVLLFAASVLGNESSKSAAYEKEEVDVPPQIPHFSKLSEKEAVAKSENAKTIKVDVQTPIKDSSPLKDVVDKEPLPLQKLEIDMKKSENAGSEAGKDVEVSAQSDMLRLSRYLRNFHERQRTIGDDEVGFARKASYVSDDYGDAVAEERAIRRRKRVRRRKIYSNIGQRRRNSNSNVSRRKPSSAHKGSNLRGGNVRNPSRRSGVQQRPSNGNKYAYRKGNKKQPNRKQSKQKRKKNKKNNKNKNKNKNKRPQKPSSQDSSSAPPKDQSPQTQDTQ